MSYQYSQEARDRISAFGQSRITEFIEEVPQAFRKAYYDRQPAIPGFRRGSPNEFKEKQKRLIGHIVNPQGGQKGEADWRMFANFWIAWAKKQIGDDFPVGDSSAPDAGSVFLNTLADRFPDAPRESVERLILFSGFAGHADTQAALGRFRPASTLARDRMIDELPGRLSAIEGYFEIAESAADEVAERIDQLFSKVNRLTQDLEQATLRTERSTAGLAELRSFVEQVANRTEQFADSLRLVDGATQKTIEAAAASDHCVQLVRQDLDVFSDRANAWDEALSKISELQGMVAQINSREPDLVRTADAVEFLSDRLEELQANLGKMRTDSGSKQQQVRLFETEPQGPLVELYTVEIACDLISHNLQASGIVKGAAISLSRQIFAALAAGQLVQFSGSLADLVADSVAAAIGGPTFHEWSVPVGLVSDEMATECLEMVADTSGCLVLKGANRSAFEIYGDALRDLVIRRQLSILTHHRLALIASWAHGPAAFPDGGTLAELGPVFDTDTFPIRGVSSVLPNLKYGQLKSDSWHHLQGFDDDISITVVTDLRALLEEASFIPGNLWARSADRAYLRLRATPGGSEEEDLHAVLMLWALPWAKSTSGPTDDLARIADRIWAHKHDRSAHFEGA
ncbi:hypothetical protein [Pseudomonas sp.]|uniref:hypothetical protein n=1 Tax=Pseudomonas sp. TaxID=306 RepID=UPI003D123D5C